MTGNPLPWIIIASAVLLTLIYKGQLRLPTPKPANATPTRPAPDVDGLVKLGSFILGLAFAKAVRIEAEASIAGQIASDAGKAIHEKFTAPFSVPAPAGPSTPGGPPTP